MVDLLSKNNVQPAAFTLIKAAYDGSEMKALISAEQASLVRTQVSNLKSTYGSMAKQSSATLHSWKPSYQQGANRSSSGKRYYQGSSKSFGKKEEGFKKPKF